MSTEPSTRRDFLKGKAAARAVGELAGSAAQALPLPPSIAEPERYLVKLSRRAMACEFAVWLNAGQSETGTAVAMEALDLLEPLEDQMSVYRAHSEISQLNSRAASGPVVVESRLLALLLSAAEWWHATGGAFDITAGPLSELWGFSRRSGRLPTAAEIATTLERVGTQYLQFDPVAQTVRYLREGVQINLGGIGKGYALDRLAEHFSTSGTTDYLLHGGNSSILACGSSAARISDEDPGGWSVGVRDPLRPEQYLGQIQLRDKAISTSGSGTQYFIHQGKRYGHILDPRTGWSVEGVLSVTALAPTGAMAEALSTALYVLGPEHAQSCLQHFPDCGCLMLCPGEKSGTVVQHHWNLADGEWLPET